MTGQQVDANSRVLSPRRFWLIVLAVFTAQVICYLPALPIKPAGDDFGTPLFDVFMVNARGPLDVFFHSTHPYSYRPTQSLLMWLFASIQPAHDMVWIHVLNLACGGLLLLACACWIRVMRLGKAGSLAALLALCFHPTYVTGLASVDGFGTPFISFIIWVGAFLTYRFRNHLARTIFLTAVCFVVGIGVKEFAVALAPLCGLVMLFFRDRRRWTAAIAIGFAVCVLFAFYMYARQKAIGDTPGKSAGISSRFVSSPLTIARNVGIYVAGLFFTGSSPWVAANPSIKVLVAAALLMASTTTLLILGLWLRLAAAARSLPEEFSPARWVLFLVASFLAASFPANINVKISEMYVIPLLLPLALLAGFAADGFARAPAGVRRLGAASGLAFLLGAVLAVQFKISAMRESGEKADLVLRSALSFVPEGQRNQRLALIFLARDDRPRPSYSVYRFSNAELLQPVAADRYRPGDNLLIDAISLNDPSEFVPAVPHDYTLLWNEHRMRFEKFGLSR